MGSVRFSGSCICGVPASGRGCGSAGVGGGLGFVGIAVAAAAAVGVAGGGVVAAAGLVVRNAVAAVAAAAAAVGAAAGAVVVANLRVGCACSAQLLDSASQIRLACRQGSGLHVMLAETRFSSWPVDCRSCAEVWQSSVRVTAGRSTVTPRIGEQRRSSLDNTIREGLEASWSGP